MSTLVSPGVSTTVIDQSQYVSDQGATVPLFFIATAEQKTQADGVTPALGTYENNVLREVTSIQQALQLYGTPRYLTDSSGNPLHGDSRSEFGLDGLIKALGIVSQAYVVRANVNLADDINSMRTLWTNNITNSADYLSTLVQQYITQYNAENNLIPADTGYKQTVDASELQTLVAEALTETFDLYSFSSQNFQNAFVLDHTVAQAGYQDVLFNTTNGYLQLSDITGLVATTSYGADIEIVSSTGTHTFAVTLLGSQAVTFGDLIAYLNAQFGAAGVSTLLNGRLRISSTLTGVTSAVSITTDGPSGYSPLFGSLNLYTGLDTPVPGTGVSTLNIYNPTYTTIVGTYDGLTAMINDWTSGSVVPDEFTPSEAEGLLLTAASDFQDTKEFNTYTQLGSNDAAKRAVIVQQLNACINNPSTGVTSDAVQYDIVACPGYFECANALVTLSQSVRSEVFVAAETPYNIPCLGPNGITTWAATPARVTSTLDAYWYGHGLSTNIDGSTILSTASSTAVRTMLYSDSVSEKWYAPAGVNRGQCPQLSTVGYVSGTLGTATTFVTDYLDQGERDALYQFPININPISYIPGRGILVMGQKTSSPETSALDRINVMRLTMYIQRQLRLALFAYLFEPDDAITWANVKYAADTFLNGIMQRRGLYDFLTVCDASNNTSTTIDNNELHLDVYLQPVKAVEFIYIEITLVNTGTDLAQYNL
jgi:hypothetical protein